MPASVRIGCEDMEVAPQVEVVTRPSTATLPGWIATLAASLLGTAREALGMLADSIISAWIYLAGAPKSRSRSFCLLLMFRFANPGLLAGSRLAWFAHDLSISDTSVFPDGSFLDTYNVVLMDGIISNGIHALQDRSSPAH